MDTSFIRDETEVALPLAPGSMTKVSTPGLMTPQHQKLLAATDCGQVTPDDISIQSIWSKKSADNPDTNIS